jgi:predicted N-acetyltransferase YhbS
VVNGPGRVFAADGPEPLPITIRLETPGDEPGVRSVELAAFTGPEEADIVDRIRDDAPAGWQSLVAADLEGRIVGHLLMTPCRVEADDGAVVGEVLAIGPVAVLPAAQFRGVGSALMGAAIGLAIARGAPAVVLLGHPAYYPRFGFTAARAMGLEPPAAAWPDAAWLGRRLPAWTESLRGTVRYHEAFEPLA